MSTIIHYYPNTHTNTNANNTNTDTPCAFGDGMLFECPNAGSVILYVILAGIVLMCVYSVTIRRDEKKNGGKFLERSQRFPQDRYNQYRYTAGRLHDPIA